ncbi:MAG: inositol monophosphatase [Spirochaetes bacterium]|nr:MAG: inositol monophosphatase [Spirochaetota bacterium]
MLEFSREIALAAGSILLKGFRSFDTVVTYKGPSNPVTNIDRESEEFLCGRIRAQYPDHAIVAEEGGSIDRDGEYLWYVDPLDGTTNFAHGVPMFCVSIGVYSRPLKTVVAGVVYDPFHEELFTAARGSGAFLNGAPLRVSKTDDLQHALLATGFPYDKGTSDDNNLPQFVRVLPQIQCIRRFGSAALDLCYVAAGRLDGYWEFKLNPWDTAAGSLIVAEAGGVVTTTGGKPFDPVSPEILVSNGIIHARILALLAGAG